MFSDATNWTMQIRACTDREKAENIGSAIRTARIEFGWTLGTVARAVGVRTSYMSSIERGRIPLSDMKRMFKKVMRAITDDKTSEFEVGKRGSDEA